MLVAVAAVRGHDGPTRRASPVAAPLDRTHARDVAIKTDYLYDSGYETCEALGLQVLARRLGTAARPATVARAFAHRFDPSIRSGPRAGCYKSLTEPATRAGSAWAPGS